MSRAGQTAPIIQADCDWPQISRQVRFERAGRRCQTCGRPHGETVRCLPDGRWYDTTASTWRNCRGRLARWPDLVETAQIRHTRVILAAAHLDHNPTNNRRRNLRSLCQRCHLIHDLPHHLARRRITYLLRRALGDLFLGIPGSHRPAFNQVGIILSTSSSGCGCICVTDILGGAKDAVCEAIASTAAVTPGIGCSAKLAASAHCAPSEVSMLPDTFRTDRLLLRPVAVADADAIFDTYAQDEEVARYVIWRPHRNREETQAYIERCLATPREVERTYMVVGSDDNVVRGAFALRQRAPHRLDCGYVLARRWWRQGLMTEVLSEVAVWALRQPSIFRLGAVCDVDNIGSARVLEKSGFIREGVLRSWLVHPNISDEPRNCYSYARVR